MAKKKHWQFETKAIHHGESVDPVTGSTASPLYLSAGFSHQTAQSLSDIFEGKRFGHIYGRISNPTVAEVEKKLTQLEDGIGSVLVATGLAGILGIVYALCEVGDEIVVSDSLFGGTFDLLNETVRKIGVKVNYVDISNLDEIKTAITDKSRFIFAEIISNPGLKVPELKAISKLAELSGIPFVLDTTLSTPYLLDAKEHGAHITIASTTKYLTGNGTVVGGVVTDLGTFTWKKSQSKEVAQEAKKFGNFAFLSRFRRHALHNAGSTISPMTAFLIGLGLETVSLRMDKHCENALSLATFFSDHKSVKYVSYPGLKGHHGYSLAKKQLGNRFGALLTIELNSKSECFKLVDSLKLVKNVANLGDAKTLIIHPESTIFQGYTEDEMDAAGVNASTLRISVGIEHIDDIKADFDQALKELGK
ncbi:acetyl-L-homoserine sulfhydrolase [Candidatus Marinamargulisbacteria bacterium SCGC AG-439-L15]|nr:acetyl-L-homoserine sulfhydrolase [Candidatus Marinamargulisbacteria bacterium SCGC AG-439-L15]